MVDEGRIFLSTYEYDTSLKSLGSHCLIFDTFSFLFFSLLSSLRACMWGLGLGLCLVLVDHFLPIFLETRRMNESNLT